MCVYKIKRYAYVRVCQLLTQNRVESRRLLKSSSHVIIRTVEWRVATRQALSKPLSPPCQSRTPNDSEPTGTASQIMLLVKYIFVNPVTSFHPRNHVNGYVEPLSIISCHFVCLFVLFYRKPAFPKSFIPSRVWWTSIQLCSDSICVLSALSCTYIYRTKDHINCTIRVCV